MSKRDEIAAYIVEGIDAGLYPAGSQLPSEHAFAQAYGVSRPTVRDALGKLAGDGRIYPAHGRGWYIQLDARLPFPLLKLDQGRAVATKDVWMTWLDSQGMEGSSSLKVSTGMPPPHVRQHLALPPGEKCAIRERMRMVDNQPVMISTAYFPLRLVADTEIARVGSGEDVDMQNPSPVRLLHEMGHGPMHDEDRIGSRRPTTSENTRLKLPPGGTVMTVCRTSTDSAGDRVRCTADVIDATRFYLTVEQNY